MSTTPPRQPPSEDLVLYGLLVVIGIIPAAIALITRAVFGFDATVGGLMAAIGLVGALRILMRP